MTTRALSCGDPDHVGDRLIRMRSAAYARRLEFRRVSDDYRERTKTTMVVCFACMEREIGGRFDARQPSLI